MQSKNINGIGKTFIANTRTLDRKETSLNKKLSHMSHM